MRLAVNNATVFLGGGRITAALISGLRLASYAQPILVYDRNPEKLRLLKGRFGVKTESDLQRAIAPGRLLIVAVRPDSVWDLLLEIEDIPRAVTAVSVAAGIPLRQLRRQLGSRVAWARAMPSPTCRFGKGLTALTFPPGTPTRTKEEVRDFFGRVGSVLEISEKKFDAFTVTYSVSHGYHALATLAKAAERIGLDRKTALTAAAHALGEGVVSWREGGIPLNELLHEAATPGGIAATVTKAMEDAGHARIVERALRAGLARARANAR